MFWNDRNNNTKKTCIPIQACKALVLSDLEAVL
nr:MAG TPA: hypothetical protein [Bacteriophage sp.]